MIKKSQSDATARASAKSTGSSAGSQGSGIPNLENAGNDTPPRRNWFYEATAAVLGAIVGLVPLGVGATTFLDPWRRKPNVPKSRSRVGTEAAIGKEGYFRVASKDALTIGDIPLRFPVIADQLDAWNFTPNQPIGAVFLQRISDLEIRCFNATCPHAGCSVGCDSLGFVCPCHNSSFQPDGTRLNAQSGRDNPSPRDLDSLEIDPERLAKQGEVWVRFQNFYTGKHEKVAKT